MKLTKYGHACVTIESGGTTILVDPGTFTEERVELLRSADAVLITHDHFDHYDADAIRAELAARPGLPVYAPGSVAGELDGVTEVSTGDEFTVAGIAVQAFIEPHAFIYGDQPQTPNAAFLIGGAVYHPGDTFFVPDVAIDTLLVPTSGPWVKLGEAIQFAIDAKPRRAIQIHEMLLTEMGQQMSARMIGPDGFGTVPLEILPVGGFVEV
ncbi:MBL fold metallo-hydrolase [Tsukamurella soli]|uniref:MBL fold metallo-hydrolase n=1 Tax=Tsukamurella soli TaxID=644556 RepID=A0ABP8KCC0_9ACTN